MIGAIWQRTTTTSVLPWRCLAGQMCNGDYRRADHAMALLGQSPTIGAVAVAVAGVLVAISEAVVANNVIIVQYWRWPRAVKHAAVCSLNAGIV